MLTDAAKRELRARIKALDEESDRMERELAEEIETMQYVEAMKRDTAKQILRMRLERMLHNDIPQGVSNFKPINKGKEIYE